MDCLGLLLLSLVLTSLSPATSFSLQDPKFPSTQARKLIRELNLFPKHSINIVDRDVTNRSSNLGSKIVEKPFKFPNLVDADSVTLEDLGHHAGYYQIEHSHDAQYIPKTLSTLIIAIYFVIHDYPEMFPLNSFLISWLLMNFSFLIRKSVSVLYIINRVKLDWYFCKGFWKAFEYEEIG